jgi:predicted TIM-barrel fold metal-dependent hydrolase
MLSGMLRRAAEIRERIGHPVIDSDGHVVEFMPLVRDLLTEEADRELESRFDTAIASPTMIGRMPARSRRNLNTMRPPFWALSASSLDRATAMLPRLLRSRLDELGIDFSFLFPTLGMMTLHVPDAEVRAAGARAFNRYSAEVFGDVRDRLEPVACVPAFTPGEALSAIEHAVDELGLKAVVLTGLVPRISQPNRPPSAFDGIGYETGHDFDAVWEACAARDLMPTFHTPAFGHGTRASARNYMHNHVGGFAAGAEGVARSLVFGGVPTRHPELRFAFMEGGAAWAVSLARDLIAHWQKRAGHAIDRYHPDHVDRRLIADLVGTYGADGVRARADQLEAALSYLNQPVCADELVDEFEASGIDGFETVERIFREQFFAGCEADDPLTCLAFDERLGPGVGVLLGSDLGHWDAPDATELLAEAWDQVERGLLTEEQLRRLTFDDPVRAWAGSGLGPFAGTALEDEIRRRPRGRGQPIQGDGSNSAARDPVSIQGKR